VLRNRRLFDSALAVNNSALIQFPKDSKFLIERGLVFNKFDRLDSAIFYFTKVLKIDEKRIDAVLYSASIYFRWKKFNKALELYKKVLDINPETPKINYSIALTLEQLGLLTKAEEFLKVQAEKDPNDSQTIIALNRVSGKVNSSLGVYKEPIPIPVKKVPVPVAKPVVVEPKRLLDTSRIRVNIILPKKKINIKTDTSRRFKF
jgi:tetratricopeptide (TPR) repeat protein